MRGCCFSELCQNILYEYICTFRDICTFRVFLVNNCFNRKYISKLINFCSISHWITHWIKDEHAKCRKHISHWGRSLQKNQNQNRILVVISDSECILSWVSITGNRRWGHFPGFLWPTGQVAWGHGTRSPAMPGREYWDILLFFPPAWCYQSQQKRYTVNNYPSQNTHKWLVLDKK